nr:NAD-dependent epimerase/dehydratase family protein [Nitrospirota bacterium]
MMATQTTALIGGTGFIGRHLLERLTDASPGPVRVLVYGPAPDWLKAMPDTEAICGDLLDAVSLSPLLDGADVAINLAGQVSAEVGDYQHVNLGGMVALAQACLQHKVRRVIHASSALVYGDALNASESDPCRPLSPYATLKLAAEEILLRLLTPAVEVVSLRLSNVYGTRQNKGLMPYLMNRILDHQPITIDSDGAQVRDFVHVKDVAEAIRKAVVSADCRGVFNIGSGTATSVMQLVRLFEEVLETPATGEYRPEHSGGERRSTVNVGKASEVLGWRATIELHDGVHELAGGVRTVPGLRRVRGGAYV